MGVINMGTRLSVRVSVFPHISGATYCTEVRINGDCYLFHPAGGDDPYMEWYAALAVASRLARALNVRVKSERCRAVV